MTVTKELAFIIIRVTGEKEREWSQVFKEIIAEKFPN